MDMLIGSTVRNTRAGMAVLLESPRVIGRPAVSAVFVVFETVLL